MLRGPVEEGGMGFRPTVTRSRFPYIYLPNPTRTNFCRLFDVLLSFAVARNWPEVASNAVSPGWVSTKMGGSYAPGSMKKATELPTWLATNDQKVTGSGKYFVAQDQKSLHKAANDEKIQEEFLRICEEISGVPFPK